MSGGTGPNSDDAIRKATTDLETYLPPALAAIVVEYTAGACSHATQWWRCS